MQSRSSSCSATLRVSASSRPVHRCPDAGGRGALAQPVAVTSTARASNVLIVVITHSRWRTGMPMKLGNCSRDMEGAGYHGAVTTTEGARMVQAEAGGDWRRNELRRFLTDRRGRISPKDVGLTGG